MPSACLIVFVFSLVCIMAVCAGLQVIAYFTNELANLAYALERLVG